jgi:hypothetical protein
VLADENHPAFGAGFFAHLPQTLGVVDKLPEAFRTGLGLPYDAFGPEGAAGIERGFAPWFRTMLVPVALPRLPGVADALRRGASAADVGCGSGVAVLELAKAFPAHLPATTSRSTRSSAPRAGSRRKRVANARFHDASRLTAKGCESPTSSPPSTVSDMAHPERVLAAVRARSARRRVPDCDIKARSPRTSARTRWPR